MSEFPKKAADRINSVAIGLVGIVSAILIWATVVALLAYYKNTNGSLVEIRDAEGKNAGVNTLKAEQSAQLKELKFADPQKGTLARLPIDRAKALVVASAKANKASYVPRFGAHNVSSIPAKAGKPIEVVPGAAAPAAPSDAAAVEKEPEAPKADSAKDVKKTTAKKIKTVSKVKKTVEKSTATPKVKAAVKKTTTQVKSKTQDIKKAVKEATGTP